MNTELGSFTKNQKDPQILKKIMKSVDGGIDGKQDGEIDFQDFLILIGGMMVACHEALMKCPPTQKNPVSATKPTDMESAMKSIVRFYQHYAGKKGAKDQMDYTEFEGFMKTELNSFTSNQKDPNIICRLMESVDGSTDGKQDRLMNFNLPIEWPLQLFCVWQPLEGSHVAILYKVEQWAYCTWDKVVKEYVSQHGIKVSL